MVITSSSCGYTHISHSDTYRPGVEPFRPLLRELLLQILKLVVGVHKDVGGWRVLVEGGVQLLQESRHVLAGVDAGGEQLL